MATYVWEAFPMYPGVLKAHSDPTPPHTRPPDHQHTTERVDCQFPGPHTIPNYYGAQPSTIHSNMDKLTIFRRNNVISRLPYTPAPPQNQPLLVCALSKSVYLLEQIGTTSQITDFVFDVTGAVAQEP
jgi:hypothetical protein